MIYLKIYLKLMIYLKKSDYKSHNSEAISHTIRLFGLLGRHFCYIYIYSVFSNLNILTLFNF